MLAVETSVSWSELFMIGEVGLILLILVVIGILIIKEALKK